MTPRPRAGKPAPRKCLFCGAEQDPDATFCDQCARPVDAASAAAPARAWEKFSAEANFAAKSAAFFLCLQALAAGFLLLAAVESRGRAAAGGADMAMFVAYTAGPWIGMIGAGLGLFANRRRFELVLLNLASYALILAVVCVVSG